MKRIKKKPSVLPLLAVMALWGTVAHAKAPEAPATVKINDGTLAGTVIDGISTFKGIPFASPPVGPNRWRAPQPLSPWQGVKKADAFAPAPMQNKLAAMVFSSNPAVEVSEDCLYLNVWAPATQKKLPVMVWIYGGGFNFGLTSSPTYEGANLAKRGVVVVSIAYRIGPFGFLAHPELSAESGHGSGNYGLMDQIAGLRWVKQNIARFGGDPSNVTIFGESAGGQSTSMLAASSQARGLFQKVICESGSSFAPIKQGDELSGGLLSLANAEKKGADFLTRLDAPTLAAARALPAQEVLEGTSGMGLFPFSPSIDGYVIRDDQYRQYLAGDFNDTPVLIGTNSDDGGMFSPAGQTPAKFEASVRGGFGAKADEILAAYPHGTKEEADQASRHLVRDVIFAWGTWSWARLQTKHGKSPAYLYYFDRYSPNTPDGAGHSVEIPYVFGTLSNRSTPESLALSNQMQLYWTNFAKTGNPNGPGLQSWPSFREPDAKVLNFGSDISVRPVPNLAQLKALDNYFAWLRSTEPAPATPKR